MFSVSNPFYWCKSHFCTIHSFKALEIYTHSNGSSSEHRQTLVVEPKNEQLHLIVDYEHGCDNTSVLWWLCLTGCNQLHSPYSMGCDNIVYDKTAYAALEVSESNGPILIEN